MSNIRYLKWSDKYNGFHIYVKVGNTDVIDKYGNQKWSSHKEAENATKWFINNIK